MVKKAICLYLDYEDCELLKARGKNLSEVIRNYIKAELGFDVEDSVEQRFQKAKLKISELTTTLSKKTEEKTQLLAKNAQILAEKAKIIEEMRIISEKMRKNEEKIKEKVQYDI